MFLPGHDEEMTPRRVGALFAAAACSARVAATFHALRHTFAGVMLRQFQRQAARNPEMSALLASQAILGHANLSTPSVYLRMVAIDPEAIEAAVDGFFGALG